MLCLHPTFRLFHRRLALGLLVLACGAVFSSADEDAEKPEKKVFTAEDLSPEQLASITVPSPDRPLHLKAGEKLTYAIGWSWFDVGEATLTLTEVDYEDTPAWKMELVAKTNGFADKFYKVRNSTRSWFDETVSQVLHYEASQREGDRERELVVSFDRENNTVQYSNVLNNDRREPISILAGTWDPMSITYYVRSLPLEVGDEYIIPTTNGKNLYLTRVSVKKKVVKDFKSGKREAFLLEPDIKDLGGVFRRSKDASIRFWFSADDRQFPLRMESSVAVGKFWAELVRVERVTASTQDD